MANRSTRRKIMDQAERMLEDVRRISEHLRGMNDLADGRSEYITSNLPLVLPCIDALAQVLQDFVSGL